MRVRVATDTCIGSGNCARTAPGVFAQRDDDGVVVLLDANPGVEEQPAVREAAAQCPVSAIALE